MSQKSRKKIPDKIPARCGSKRKQIRFPKYVIQTKTEKFPTGHGSGGHRVRDCAVIFKSLRSTKKKFLCGQLTPAIVYHKSGNCHGQGMISRLECLPGKNENLKKKKGFCRLTLGNCLKREAERIPPRSLHPSSVKMDKRFIHS